MRWLWFESSPYFQECKVESIPKNRPVRPHQGLDQSPKTPRSDQISAASLIDPPPLGYRVLHRCVDHWWLARWCQSTCRAWHWWCGRERPPGDHRWRPWSWTCRGGTSKVERKVVHINVIIRTTTNHLIAHDLLKAKIYGWGCNTQFWFMKLVMKLVNINPGHIPVQKLPSTSRLAEKVFCRRPKKQSEPFTGTYAPTVPCTVPGLRQKPSWRDK